VHHGPAPGLPSDPAAGAFDDLGAAPRRRSLELRHGLAETLDLEIRNMSLLEVLDLIRKCQSS
jgi:hypothetical protein